MSKSCLGDVAAENDWWRAWHDEQKKEWWVWHACNIFSADVRSWLA
jgi:hypothetical protein